MIRRYLQIALIAIITACGQQEAANNDTQVDPVAALQKQVNDLQLTTNALNASVDSDFKSCTGSASYATDKLTNRICQIAQAANSEDKEVIRGQIETYAQSLQGEIDAMNTDLQSINVSQVATLQTQINSIQSNITTIQGQITTLTTNLATATTNIAALQVLTNSLNNTLANAFAPVEIGTELLTAGPLYESLLRSTDQLLIHGFVTAQGAGQTVVNNGAAVTNGSATVTITVTTHGLASGDFISLTGLAGTGNVTRADLQGEFVVTVVNANTFTVSISHNSTSTQASFGDVNGVVTKIIARGLGRIWQTSDGSSVAVLVAQGSRPYNFIIKKGLTGAISANAGYICYDKTNRLATFATINAATAAGTTGNIICK